MSLKYFICPDGQRIETIDCLKEGGCRMGDRCATRSYLHLASKDRPWTGKPSTTQLIQGTMEAYLKIKKDYATSPDGRAFMINGTNAHRNLEENDDDFSFIEEKFTDGDVTGIADVFEVEKGKSVLVDYKTSGSYKVAKALGMVVVDVETGEVYKSGKRKGEQKTRKELRRDETKIDVRDWALQLNKYRMLFESKGFKANEIKIQVIVRDGSTWIARSRGVYRNIYFFKIPMIPDDEIILYFKNKARALFKALEHNDINKIQTCTKQENWNGLKCERYCDVAEFCPYGRYLKKEKETDEMAIKGLSEARRLPRLGKIRLGIKKQTAKGVEYPSEVDYFILDPQTPNELEKNGIIDEFHSIYGDKPKQINMMFPTSNVDLLFPQFYKRYGTGTSLQCRGDGNTAKCADPKFAEGLEIIAKDELTGAPIVKCNGENCPYYAKRKCVISATLNILIPELPGVGVWQINTSSINSIININSGLDIINKLVGRVNMLPLKLERKPQETTHDGKKAIHYMLHINTGIYLKNLQGCAQIDSTKALLELPAPDFDEQDLMAPAVIDATEVVVEKEKTDEEAHVELSEKLCKVLMELSGNNKDLAQDMLEGYSTFINGDGNEVSGKRDTKALSLRRLRVTYGKAKKELKDNKKGAEGVEFPFGEENGVKK